MSPADIKSAIAKAGTSQAAIADFLDVTVQSVNAVVNGRMRSPRIEAELEKIIGPGAFAPYEKKKGGRKKTVWTGAINTTLANPVGATC